MYLNTEESVVLVQVIQNEEFGLWPVWNITKQGGQ